MASVSGLGSPQSSASGGFSGRLNILYIIKGMPKPEKKDLPLDTVLSCISGWSRSSDGTDLQSSAPGQGSGQQEEHPGSVLWHPSSTLMPARGNGTRPRGQLSQDASGYHIGKEAPAHAL